MHEVGSVIDCRIMSSLFLRKLLISSLTVRKLISSGSLIETLKLVTCWVKIEIESAR